MYLDKQIEVDIVRVEEPKEFGVELAQLDARRGATLAVRKIPAGSGMGLTVVLQKLFKARVFLSIRSRSRSNSKNFRARILLDLKCHLFRLPGFVLS